MSSLKSLWDTSWKSGVVDNENDFNSSPNSGTGNRRGQCHLGVKVGNYL